MISDKVIGTLIQVASIVAVVIALAFFAGACALVWVEALAK